MKDFPDLLLPARQGREQLSEGGELLTASEAAPAGGLSLFYAATLTPKTTEAGEAVTSWASKATPKASRLVLGASLQFPWHSKGTRTAILMLLLAGASLQCSCTKDAPGCGSKLLSHAKGLFLQ